MGNSSSCCLEENERITKTKLKDCSEDSSEETRQQNLIVEIEDVRKESYGPGSVVPHSTFLQPMRGSLDTVGEHSSSSYKGSRNSRTVRCSVASANRGARSPSSRLSEILNKVDDYENIIDQIKDIVDEKNPSSPQSRKSQTLHQIQELLSNINNKKHKHSPEHLQPVRKMGGRASRAMSFAPGFQTRKSLYMGLRPIDLAQRDKMKTKLDELVSSPVQKDRELAMWLQGLQVPGAEEEAAEQQARVLGVDGRRKLSKAMSKIKAMKLLKSSASDDDDAVRLVRDMLLNDHLNECMSTMSSDYNFDIFQAHKLSNGIPLTATAMHIFNDSGLSEEFNISTTNLANFVRACENGYKNSNPYHNSTHAADVTACVYYWLRTESLQRTLPRLEHLICIVSAIIHDIGHPGTNADFHIKTQSELALLYNDNSILEQYHLSQAFRLLKTEQCNIFKSFSKEEFLEIRKMIIQIVLSTDICKHMQYVTSMNELSDEATSPEPLALDDEENTPQYREVIRNALMKVSDLSNPTKNNKLMLAWCHRVLNEFWNQGDLEQQLGFQVSPMMDRTNPNIERSQLGFIDFLVTPLFDAWASLIPEGSLTVDNLKTNRAYWEKQLGKIKPSQSSS